MRCFCMPLYCFLLGWFRFLRRAQAAASTQILEDLVPGGKLRAAINLGNSMLAQRRWQAEPKGITSDLAPRARASAVRPS